MVKLLANDVERNKQGSMLTCLSVLFYMYIISVKLLFLILIIANCFIDHYRAACISVRVFLILAL